MESDSIAPIVLLSTVAPSLSSTPAKSSPASCTIIIPDETTEVRFATGSMSSSSTSSSSITDLEEIKPKIPDGGWGWMVVFASFFLSMIADGISFSFGLLYVEFLYEFGASKSATSWIGSLFMAVPLLTGPIMSALVDKYGCKSMTILGGIISAIGFIISSRCHSIVLMYLTFGTLAGLGLGLCYVTAVVSIAFWFEKKRTLAMGLGAAGTGVGTFIFSPLTTFLLYEYGWRGTTLILAGCFFYMCVCGCLMRDPEWIIKQNSQSSKKSKSTKSSKTSLVSVLSTSPSAANIDIEKLKLLLTNGKDVEILLKTLETTLEDENDENLLKKYFQSALNLPTYIKDNEKVPFEVLDLLSKNKKLYNIVLQTYPSLILGKGASENASSEKTTTEKVARPKDLKLTQIHQCSLPESHDIAVQEPLLGDKATRLPTHASFPRLKPHWHNVPKHDNYFKNLKVHRQSLVHRGAIFTTNKYKFKASSCPNIYRVSMMSLPKTHDEEKWYTELIDLVKGMFDYSLFLELHFFLMSLSTIILFVWFIVPYFYIAELMLKHDYDNEDTSFTLSIIGIANTIGMVVLGWAGDRPWVNITKTYAICLVLCGISIAGIMLFIDNYIMLEISAALFGLFLSSTFSFTPGILVELVPLERFTIAYGLQLLCMGIGILVGPPYAGLLFDLTHNWKQSFYQAAIWTVLSGILIWIIPYTKNKKMIGKGPVEKEIKNSKNKVVFIILLLILLCMLMVALAYLTVICLL